MDNSMIAERLVALRGDRSREEVAKALQISVSAVTMYELGERIPRDEVKIRIANYYGATVESIFYAQSVTESDLKEACHHDRTS